jgi:4'-phosphopantetheinyl transferase superfamily
LLSLDTFLELLNLHTTRRTSNGTTSKLYPPLDVANARAFSTIATTKSLADGSAIGVGVDQGSSNFIIHESLITFMLLELISSVFSHSPTFVCHNFTESKIAYCCSQPASSFTAHWVGKEAVFKSLGVKSKSAATAIQWSTCMVTHKPAQLSLLVTPRLGVPIYTTMMLIVQSAARGDLSLSIG